MWHYLKSLVSRPLPLTPEEAERDRDPVALATVMNEQDGISGKAAASDVAPAETLYSEFLEAVCVRPGLRLVDQLQATDAAEVVVWFRPETPEPEPKALIQLFVELARRGQMLQEQPGFELFISGRWSQGGGSSDASYEALQYLVRAIGRPIHVYFQTTPRDEGFRVTTIEPEA